MPNLFTKRVVLKDFVKLADLTNITFEENTKYLIQIIGNAYIREGMVGTGFLIDDNKPFEYQLGTYDLYINSADKNDSIVINIAN